MSVSGDPLIRATERPTLLTLQDVLDDPLPHEDCNGGYCAACLRDARARRIVREALEPLLDHQVRLEATVYGELRVYEGRLTTLSRERCTVKAAGGPNGGVCLWLRELEEVGKL